MIRATGKNSRAMNQLADKGVIKPVTITWPETNLMPVCCNCIWAATDYLKKNGFYEPGTPLHQFA